MKPKMSPRAASPYTVLVVDDDPSVLATYRRLLSRSGYRAMAVDDPRRVLEACYHDQPIDLLLLDYKMPGMDGLTLLAELRRRDCRAKCVLLSAFVNDEVQHRAQHLGVARLLEKPVDATALLGVLHELLPARDERPVTVALHYDRRI
jgi:CheY-like chemotaxis protein